jgi:hypothetical protein
LQDKDLGLKAFSAQIREIENWLKKQAATTMKKFWTASFISQLLVLGGNMKMCVATPVNPDEIII